MTIYVVKQGDTVASIAQQFGVTVQRLIIDNELPNPGNLVVGQSIAVRFPEVTHTIVQGDTLTSVAQQYGVTTIRIYQNNPWAAAEDTLVPGETLVISFREQATDGNAVVNGYAYPYINQTVLRKTLPFLTYLSIFTYGFNAQGELVPVEDEPLIAAAKEFGTGPVMMLAPMIQGPQGQEFNTQIAHDMFVNDVGKNNLINNIITNMQTKGYVALDIDFEYVQPSDKELFINFLRTLKSRLQSAGFLLFVDLAPKTSGAMTGLLYEAHDYPVIGAIADKVLLMTYEWGYKYGPPEATSPINNMRSVLQYGVSVIPKEKILMGLPNYAYDWPLPFVKGTTAADTISNQEAVERAAEKGVPIQFDEPSQSPFYNYTTDSVQHVVWFDDARSMNSKIRLIPEFSISGAGCWQIMDFFPAAWMVVNELFTVVKQS